MAVRRPRRGRPAGPRLRLPRGIGLRPPRGAGEWAAAGLVVTAASVCAVKVSAAMIRVLTEVWPVLPFVVAAAGAVGGWRARRSLLRRRRERERLAALCLPLAVLDTMDDRCFEYALRDLLVRDGWSARRVGGSGDQSADVIARHARWGRLVVQAKHTRVGGKVRSSVMYALKGTAGTVHGADHAVVVTNGGLTRDARAWGDRHGVGWLDRERLRRWAEEGAALHELLGLPPRGRIGGVRLTRLPGPRRRAAAGTWPSGPFSHHRPADPSARISPESAAP